MRNSRRADQLGAFVAGGAVEVVGEVVEEPLAAAEQDGNDRHVQFVDQAGARPTARGRWHCPATS